MPAGFFLCWWFGRRYSDSCWVHSDHTLPADPIATLEPKSRASNWCQTRRDRNEGEAQGVRSNAMVFVYPRRMFVRRTIFLRPKQAIKLQFQVAALRDAFGEVLHFFQEFLLHYLSPARSEKIRSNIAYRYLLKPMSLAFSRKH